MRAAACHYALAPDPEANCQRLLAAVDRALPDADLVVAPEAATTGVDGPAADAAEPLDGETVGAVRSAVDRHGGTVVLGLPERAGNQRYNTAVVVDADGVRRHRQSRTDHTYAWTTGYGDAPVATFDTDAGRLAVALCWQVHSPAVADALADEPVTAVAVPANWGEVAARRPLLDRWAERGAELGVPLVVGNVARGETFDGPAAVVAPGRDRAASRAGRPAVATL